MNRPIRKKFGSDHSNADSHQQDREKAFESFAASYSHEPVESCTHFFGFRE